MTIDDLAEENPEALTLDGFDEAFVGIARRCGQPSLAVYDRGLCLGVLERQGMTPEEAEEFFTYNTEGSWAGEMTPIILDASDLER